MNLFLLLLVVFLNGGIKGIIWGMLLSSVTGASLGYLLYRNNFIIRKLKVSQERCKFFIKEALPLALYAFILVLFYKVDIYFLKYYRSNNEIGLYQAASQFVLMWSVIPTALAASLFPSFSRYAETDRERFISVYSKTLKYLLILGLAIVLTILYLTEEIIYLVYGSNFIEASSAMRILAWTILMVFFNVLLNTILTAVNKQFWNTVAAAACLLLNVCIDAIFIPQYGYISACYATLASFIVLFFITFYSVNKFVVSINLIDLLCKPFICVAVPVLMLVVSRKSGYLFLVPSLIIYFMQLLLFKVVSADEIKQFIKVFNKGHAV